MSRAMTGAGRLTSTRDGLLTVMGVGLGSLIMVGRGSDTSHGVGRPITTADGFVITAFGLGGRGPSGASASAIVPSGLPLTFRSSASATAITTLVSASDLDLAPSAGWRLVHAILLSPGTDMVVGEEGATTVITTR